MSFFLESGRHNNYVQGEPMSGTIEAKTEGYKSPAQKRNFLLSIIFVIIIISALVAYSFAANGEDLNKKVNAAAECPWNLARSIKVVVLYDRSSFVGVERHGGSPNNIDSMKSAIADDEKGFLRKLYEGETEEIQIKRVVLLPFAQKVSPAPARRTAILINNDAQLNIAEQSVRDTVFKTNESSQAYLDPYDPSTNTDEVSEGTSNWHLALHSTNTSAANGATHVVMITGSNPTTSGTDVGPDFTTDENDIANAVSAAGDLVNRRAKLYVVGAGNKVSPDVINRVAAGGKGYYGNSYSSLEGNLNSVIDDIYDNDCEPQPTTTTTTTPPDGDLRISVGANPDSGTYDEGSKGHVVELSIVNNSPVNDLQDVHLNYLSGDVECPEYDPEYEPMAYSDEVKSVSPIYDGSVRIKTSAFGNVYYNNDEEYPGLNNISLVVGERQTYPLQFDMPYVNANTPPEVVFTICGAGRVGNEGASSFRSTYDRKVIRFGINIGAMPT